MEAKTIKKTTEKEVEKKPELEIPTCDDCDKKLQDGHPDDKEICRCEKKGTTEEDECECEDSEPCACYITKEMIETCERILNREDEIKDEFLPIKKPKITEEMRAKLNVPFIGKAVSQHPTKKFLSTLKAIYIVERLNDVFGLGRWNLEHKVVVADKGYVLMEGQLKILDYDVQLPIQYGGHTTTGTNTELADGYKSAITDILSKSASYLEIGIEVFKGEAGKVQYTKPQPVKAPAIKKNNPLDGFAETLSSEIEKVKNIKDLMGVGQAIAKSKNQGDLTAEEIANLQQEYSNKVTQLNAEAKQK